jgi:hypothetical protein
MGEQVKRFVDKVVYLFFECLLVNVFDRRKVHSLIIIMEDVDSMFKVLLR